MAAGNILVTGAAGGMGVPLVRGLLDRGWTVRALILPGDPLRSRLLRFGCEVREGNIATPESLVGVCDGIDTVYHLAAVIISHDPSVFRRINRDGTANIVAAAAAANVRHFIHVSSASVTYPRRTAYAESKLEAEGIVRTASAFEHTIVRPTLAYDEFGGQEVRMFLEYLQRFPIVPFIGSGRAVKRPVWTADIVDGLLRLANSPVSYGKTYNLSGGQPISMVDFAHLLLRHHGGDKRFVSIPVPVCRAIARVLGAFTARPPLTNSAIAGVVNDADLDPGEAMRDLGYQPIGVRDGLELCFPIAQTPRQKTALPEPIPHAKGSFQ
jgi:nucleoside-diphosphate-sugar epimerase